MLEKIGNGTTLEDLQEARAKGGLKGSCGTNACMVCGASNHVRLADSYSDWYESDY